MMAAERANLFCVFLRVPRPAVVALSRAKIKMGQEDDDEEEEVTSPHGAGSVTARACIEQHLFFKCMACRQIRMCCSTTAHMHQVRGLAHAPQR